MKIRKTLRWLGLLLAALVVMLTLLVAFAPWKAWLEQKIITAITAKGFGPVALTLDHVGLRALSLRDVTLGEPPLTLAALTLGYAPRALLKGTLEDVRMNGVKLSVTQGAQGWVVDGLPPMPPAPAGEEKAANIPLSAQALQQLPFKQLALADATLNVVGNALEATMTLDANLEHGTATALRLAGRALELKLASATITLAAWKLELALDEAAQQWTGNWTVDGLGVESEALQMPALSAQGTLAIKADTITFTGSMKSQDKSYHAAFDGQYSLVKPASSQLMLRSAQLPWSGGNIALTNAKLPLVAGVPIAVTLHVQKVAIDTLMQALTGSKATASGVVSGDLPVRVSKTGAITIGKTSLKAEGPGIISLSPEVIPGDNAQVTMVRDLLKNLHYTVLALDLDMAPDNTLSATLAVEGANPDALGARPVKLNVHLSGDLLNFIVQNTQLMTDPKSFIEQKNHE